MIYLYLMAPPLPPQLSRAIPMVQANRLEKYGKGERMMRMVIGEKLYGNNFDPQLGAT